MKSKLNEIKHEWQAYNKDSTQTVHNIVEGLTAKDHSK